jgi:hypothetical protein
LHAHQSEVDGGEAERFDNASALRYRVGKFGRVRFLNTSVQFGELRYKLRDLSH